MTTAYVDEQYLRDTYGDSFIEEALRYGVRLPAVLESIHAEVDAYVSKQVALPLSVTAISQCRTAAAKLVAHQLFVQTPSESLIAGAAEARRFLEAVAASKVLLHVEATSACTPEGVCTSPPPVEDDFLFSAAPRTLSRRR